MPFDHGKGVAPVAAKIDANGHKVFIDPRAETAKSLASQES
jgi:hypothetical protein